MKNQMAFYFYRMMQYIEWVWFFCLLIITGHHMLVFRLSPLSRGIQLKDWPGVSIIIAHKDHLGSLDEGLSNIALQDYPLFEIIIVDDNSPSPVKEKLHNSVAAYANVRVIENEGSGKKNAINTGVKHALYDRILCTDADCRPSGDQWIKTMVMSGRSNEVVLGYSPLTGNRSWLSKLIRFETLYTAIQYLSWARTGRAYMGVGRNLLYPRILFLKLNPYVSNIIPYGDDDLIVQQMAEHARIKTCDNPQSFMMSRAPATLREWLRQKHRHLSAGHAYTHQAWWTPAIFAMCLFAHWLLVIPLIIFSMWWKWLPVLIIGLLLRWFNYFRWTGRLGERDTIIWYPFLEILYSAYLGMGGAITAFFKKRTWN